jgi:ferritin-like metal-binding protein YciE
LSGTETLGGMAEALAAARTVEPTAGDHSAPGHTHESACLNCGTALMGSHCHACGQAAHVHKTLGAFFHDLLHGVFHFEGKIWRTLPLLALQPGKLTREYIDGRRASYVSPIALFLFCVFLMFTAINSLDGDFNANVNMTVDQALKNERKDLSELQTARKEAAGDAALLEKIDKSIAESQDDIAAIEKVKASGVNVSNIDTSDLETASDIGWINEAVKKAKANPGLALYKVQNYSYKLSWALIPISVPFLWLLFPFSRRFGLYDHTVFVTYSLCFITLLAVVAMLAGKAGVPLLGLLALLPPAHMLLQLRGTYGLSWFGAWWRTWFLSMFAFAALMLFAALILVEAGG